MYLAALHHRAQAVAAGAGGIRPEEGIATHRVICREEGEVHVPDNHEANLATLRGGCSRAREPGRMFSHAGVLRPGEVRWQRRAEAFWREIPQLGEADRLTAEWRVAPVEH